MIQEKPKSNELVVKESRTRKLAYTPEFKSELVSNPNVFRKFLKLKSGLKFEGDKTVDDNLEIELIKRHEDYDAAYYKVIIGSRAYFVKELPAGSFKGGGTLEIKSAQKAQKILEENKIDWAEMVDFKFGYEGGGKRYFVSVWNENFRQNLASYMYDLDKRVKNGSMSKSEYDSQKELIEKGLWKLRDILTMKGFYDVFSSNMAINSEFGKMYLFDLQHEDLNEKI